MNFNCHSFTRYANNFEAIKDDCTCGGKFNDVDLTKSDRNTLTLKCSRSSCSCVTTAHRKRSGSICLGARFIALVA